MLDRSTRIRRCATNTYGYDVVVADFRAMFLAATTIDALNANAVETCLENVDGITALIDI